MFRPVVSPGRARTRVYQALLYQLVKVVSMMKKEKSSGLLWKIKLRLPSVNKV